MSHINAYYIEQESERALQEFSQKMESLKRGHDLEMESLAHEAQLKQKDAEVFNLILRLPDIQYIDSQILLSIN